MHISTLNDCRYTLICSSSIKTLNLYILYKTSQNMIQFLKNSLLCRSMTNFFFKSFVLIVFALIGFHGKRHIFFSSKHFINSIFKIHKIYIKYTKDLIG